MVDHRLLVVLMSRLIDDLEDLSNVIGVSGFESHVRNIILSKIEDLPVKSEIDRLGNLVVIKEGMEDGPRVLLDAHMDEVGFITTHIDDHGFIRFEKLGSWDDRTLLGHPVKFQLVDSSIRGVVGTKPPHLQKKDERDKVIQSDKMFVDIGASSAEEVGSVGIEVGTPFTIHHSFSRIGFDRVMGKAFDDRVGCAILIHILKGLIETYHTATFIFNFTVCEEVGGRGATTAAYSAEPDMALAIENTAAGDIPGIENEKCPTRLGKGPAITVADKSLIAHPKIVETLKSRAQEEGIPYQIKKPLYGGTDAGRIALTRSGVPSGVLSCPCRYIHNGLSLLDLSDLQACADLVSAFCTGI